MKGERMTLPLAGAGCFGLVIGWITYRTLRRATAGAQLSDIAAVIAAVGGGAVTVQFSDKDSFGAYSIGLAIGFFAYFLVGLYFDGWNAGGWLGDADD
jgi:hypothetical protein